MKRAGKVGDKVKINPKSEYKKQGYWSDNTEMIGEIFTVHDDPKWSYTVKWPNQRRNTYRGHDLLLLVSPNEADSPSYEIY